MLHTSAVCYLPEPEECLSGKLTLRSIMDAKALQRCVMVCVGVYLVYFIHLLILIIYFGSCGSCPNGFGGNGISPTEKNTRYVASPLWNPIRQRAFHLTRYSRDSKLPGCTDRKLPPHHCSPQPTGFAWKFSYLCRYRLCGRAGFEIGQSVKIVEVLFVSRSTAENEHDRNICGNRGRGILHMRDHPWSKSSQCIALTLLCFVTCCLTCGLACWLKSVEVVSRRWPGQEAIEASCASRESLVKA